MSVVITTQRPADSDLYVLESFEPMLDTGSLLEKSLGWRPGEEMYLG
jgi:hypothetical protein